MAERAVHLVDEVLPQVPVRQSVVTQPYRLRHRLAWDHGRPSIASKPRRRVSPAQDVAPIPG
jgi:hypothetical protein